MTAQIFEAVFVMVSRTALKHPDAIQMEDIAPLSGKAYKQPITALLKELTSQDQINTELAKRIFDLIEDRNMLVHRIFLVHTSEVPVKDIFDDALIHLCRRVYSEAGVLISDLLELFFDYSSRFPEAAKFLTDNKDTFDEFSKITRAIRAKVFA